MKRLTICIFLCAMVTQLFAVAPVQGLGLKEPVRKTISSPFSTNGSRRMAAGVNRTPEYVNLAPRGLLLLVEFQELSFAESNKPADFDSLANGLNYSYNGATGSAREYFRAQSNGAYIPHFDVFGPICLPHPYAYYGANDDEGVDMYSADLIMDACLMADSMGVDFSPYDNNGDSILDFVYILYAGYAESSGGEANTIWPHAWDISSALVLGDSHQDVYYVEYDFDTEEILSYNLPVLDGLILDRYACSNEVDYRSKTRTGIGTLCHEFSHVLGLPDYYVTSEDAEMYDKNMTPGSWSLMDYGNYLNGGNTPPAYSAFDKALLGWLSPSVLSAHSRDTLDAGDARMVTHNGTIPENGVRTTDTVYYLENRQMNGWDTYLPGHGMIVWRVVYDEEEWISGRPNDNAARYTIITADGSTPRTTRTAGGQNQSTPFPGLTHTTTLSLFDTSISEIEEQNGCITFKVCSVPSDIPSIPRQTNTSGIYYNLLGQIVNPESYHGIVIVDGTKILLK